MPRSISDLVTRGVPVLRPEHTVRDAVSKLLDSNLPALPVQEEDGKFAGVFGEREFMVALFPGYVGSLRTAGFVGRAIEAVFEKRAACADERVGQHMTTDHVEVGEDFSDVQVAEVFLHHRVLIVPVCSAEGVVGVITRSDFFRALAERFIAGSG